MEKLRLPISVLDLVPILEGQTATDAFVRARELAKHVDELGYTRYWLAEHHNSRAIASSATAIGIGYIGKQRKLFVSVQVVSCYQTMYHSLWQNNLVH